MPAGRRILIVAHKSVATPSLLQALRARTAAAPCRLALLIPDAGDPASLWTLRRARRLLSQAVGTPVDGIVAEGEDPYEGIAAALREDAFDEVLISTLPEAGSQWLRDDLPARIRRLGVPVTVVSATPVPSG
jgi:hypothetical protein